MTEPTKCAVDGCKHAAEPGRSLCATHRKRKQRTGDTGPAEIRRRNGSLRALLNAALDLGDVDPDDDAEWDRAIRRFRRAAEAFRRGTPAGDNASCPHEA